MGTAPEDDVRAALAEIEREWLKAVAIGAVVDAALAIVAVSVAAVFLWPSAFTRPFVGPVSTGAALAVVVGVAVAAAELALQLRRSTVERFEAANPEVREALRTARDAVERDHRGPVAAAHYRSVVDRLGETSSRDMLPIKRLTLTVAVVGVLAVGTLFVPAGGAVDAVTASFGDDGIGEREPED